jgi:hypothetical protein
MGGYSPVKKVTLIMMIGQVDDVIGNTALHGGIFAG